MKDLKQIQEENRRVIIMYRNPEAKTYEEALEVEKNTVSDYIKQVGSWNPSDLCDVKDEVVVWRYLTLPKFLDLIQTKELYYTNTKILRKDDRYEDGILHQDEISQYKQAIGNVDWKNTYIKLDSYDKIEALFALVLHEAYEEKETFVNCWNVSDIESYNMWKTYVPDGFGIAIKSTYSRLIKCYNDQEYKIQAKRVIYNQYRDQKYLAWLYSYIPKCLIKRGEFSSEKELRLLIPAYYKSRKTDELPIPIGIKDTVIALYRRLEGKELGVWSGKLLILDGKPFMSLFNGAEKPTNSDGIKIKVDLNILIEKIYINPFSPDYFRDIIVKECQQNYLNISDKNIIKSSI